MADLGFPRVSFARFVFVMSLLTLPTYAFSGEDDDLQFLPQTKEFKAAPVKSKPRSQNHYHVFIEQSGALMGNRTNVLVPLPTTEALNRFTDSSLDILADVKLASRLTFNLSDRLDYFYYDQTTIRTDETQNTLREVYFSWNPYQSFFVELGRINIKNGVALGFNPTDYFKRNAVNTELSQDLQVLKEKRMGALMLKSSLITEHFSLIAAFAPKVKTEPNQMASNQKGSGLLLNKTNSLDQFLAKLTIPIGYDFNPEFLFFQEGSLSSFGFNMSYGLGKSVVFYFEWSGSQRPSLANEATANYLEPFQTQNPPVTPSLAVDYNNDKFFYRRASAGFSAAWNSIDTTYLEYHYNEAGFNDDDWDTWFREGQSSAASTVAAIRTSNLGQLWSIRDYARNNQEPMNMHSLFLRNSLTLSGSHNFNAIQILNYNMIDQSAFFQIQFDYTFINALTTSAIAYWNIGTPHSEYGSIPRQQEYQLAIRYYF